MIEIRGVSRSFRTMRGPGRGPGVVHALRAVDLTVEHGTVLAVVGPNAAGKSTLLSLVLGFLEPGAGRVDIDGLAPRRFVAREGAGYLPERFTLPAGWPVRGGLRALARLNGADRASASERADAAIERFGLAGYAERTVGELSRGLLQRLGLAQALLVPARLIVLDEPTEGLDPLWRLRLREMVDEASRGGATILFSSHDLGEVEQVADRVALLDDGVLREVFTVAEPVAERRRYRLRLHEPGAAVEVAFPGARPVADDGAARPSGDGDPARRARDWWVEVAGSAELSARLAALLAGGALIEAVEPARDPLEERVRRGLGGERS